MIKILNAKDVACDKFLERLVSRGELDSTEQLTSVKSIINDVKSKKDEALFKYTEMFDKATIDKDTIKVSNEEINNAIQSLDPKILDIMKQAAQNIRDFHKLQVENEKVLKSSNGTVSLRYVPVDRAGVYVPGGRAAYPSSVLMNVIPAKVAGVKDIIMCTPPDENGVVYNMTLAAASIAGVDKIFKVGGAQAIAAMAYGTESIPKVSKIVGPGNIYVALAKKEVFGQVGIDMVAGPSEVLIIADDTAKANYLAADLLSQAEHDPMAASILLIDNKDSAKSVSDEIESQLENLPTEKIARQSIEDMGAIIIVNDIKEAINIANNIAPEHLEICTKEPYDVLQYISNAGAIFMGEYSPEPLGDYFAGSNHVLPTSGNAKFSSPLGAYDFMKKQSVINYSESGLKDVSEKIVDFAKGEGLYAHAKAVSIRFEEEQS